MRRARACGAVALALLVAAPAAHAQDPSGTPIVGSGSLSRAPELRTGVTYEDSVLGGETVYYAVRLQAGQRFRASLVSSPPPEEFRAPFLLEAEALDSLRRLDTGAQDTGRPGDTVQIQSPTAVPASTAGFGADDAGPGLFYVAVSGTQVTEGIRPDIAYRLRVDVEGAAQQATPEPSPSPSPTPEADAEGGDDPSLALVGGLGVAGLLVGGVGGASLKRRARRG